MAKSRTECTNDTWIIHKSIEPHIITIPQYVIRRRRQKTYTFNEFELTKKCC